MTLRLAPTALALLAVAPLTTAQHHALAYEETPALSGLGAGESSGSTLAGSGDWALLGSEGGLVRVLRNGANGWTEHAVLPPTFGSIGFGAALALDGAARAFVAAPGDAGTAGQVAVFVRQAGVWSIEALLSAPIPGVGDAFGAALAAEGNELVVGAPGTGNATGAAYVFTRTGSAWSYNTSLTAFDGAAGDEFGHAVGIEDEYVACGAPGDDGDRGSVYLFEPGGVSWLKRGDFVPEAGARYGTALVVDWSGSSLTVVAGAPGAQGGAGTASGFELTQFGSYDWPVIQGLSQPGDAFGSSVAGLMGSSWRYTAIGAPGASGGRGRAHLLGGDDTVTLSPGGFAEGAPGEALGTGVAMAGFHLLAGAPGRDASAPDAGGVDAHRALTQGQFGVCFSLPNSTGSRAIGAAQGSVSITENDLCFAAGPVPTQPGLFFFGLAPANVPFGNGVLCVQAPISRLAPTTATGNVLSTRVDFSVPPAASLVAGQDVHAQAWFRDPSAGGAGYNFSDSIWVHLLP